MWSPDGAKIAYLGGGTDPDGNEARNIDLWTFDLNSEQSNQDIFSGVQEAFRGLSWGTPSTVTPLLRLRINDPHPLTAGVSTTGTVYLTAPAPSGGTTVTLTRLGAAGIITLPPFVNIPEGETQANFQIDSAFEPTTGTRMFWQK